MRRLLASVVVLSISVSSARSADASTRPRPDVPVDTVEVVHTWPHDPNAVTQGLVFDGRDILESSGQYGASTLRRVDLRTGQTLQRVELGPEYFAEGIALLRGKVYQLTWHEGRCLVYDAASFIAQDSLPYRGEAWGLTHDGGQLILSDGTSQLRYLDPTTFAVGRTIRVLDAGRPVMGLNELEYVGDQIYANVLGERRIARIDPRNGQVLGWIDLTDLVAAVPVTDEDAVLNGIAYDGASGRLFVTGKRWPNLFEVRIRPQPALTAGGDEAYFGV